MKFLIRFLIAFVIWAILTLSTCNAKSRVTIFNGLKNDALSLHCNSRDDDLGTHALLMNHSFSFRFGIDHIFQRTRFWCEFNWGETPLHGGKFRIFWIGSGLAYKCHDQGSDEWCKWSAREDGLYLYNSGEKRWEFYYYWAH